MQNANPTDDQDTLSMYNKVTCHNCTVEYESGSQIRVYLGYI